MGKPPDASRARAILRERARLLARPLAEQGDDASIDVLEFRLAQERYALDARAVRDVLPLKDLTPVPCTPAFLAGLVNVRGRIVPVIDVKRFFALPEDGIADLHQVVLVGAGEVEVGLLADVVEGVVAVEPDALQASVAAAEIRGEHFKGVSRDGLIVLDVESILRDERLIVDEEVEL